METYGIGMVGYGFMGKMHTYAYQSLPFIYDPSPARIKLVGVCTSGVDSGQKAVDQAGYQFATTDYHDLIERDDIDIINVCTPNYTHKDVVIDALNAGKHVYCDKPLALDLEEAREIWETARDVKSIHQMTFQYRFIPAILRAKQLIESGLLGRVYQFRAAFLHSGNIDPNRPLTWRMNKSKSGGGAAFDLGSHVIDLTRYLLGEFKSVQANAETFIKDRPISAGSAERMAVDVDDVIWIHAQMQNGSVGTIEATRLATGANDEIRIEVHGEKGAIRFNSMDANWLDYYDATLSGGDYGGDRGFKRIECVQQYPKPAVLPGPKFAIGWMRYHIASVYEFVKNISECRQSEPSIYDGLRTQEIIEAAYRSSDTGIKVNL